jgi:hypothetical protein
VIAARSAALAANTPWYLVKWTRGGGTSAARRAMKSKGSSRMSVVPSDSRRSADRAHRESPRRPRIRERAVQIVGRAAHHSAGVVRPDFHSGAHARELAGRARHLAAPCTEYVDRRRPPMEGFRTRTVRMFPRKLARCRVRVRRRVAYWTTRFVGGIGATGSGD